MLRETLTGGALFSELGLGPDRPLPLSEEAALALGQVYATEKLLWALLTVCHQHSVRRKIEYSNFENFLTTKKPSGSEGVRSTDLVPGRDATTVCLKLYRKILQSAHWKSPLQSLPETDGPPSSSNSSNSSSRKKSLSLSGGHLQLQLQLQQEVDEYFAVVNIFATLCKAVIQAHNSHQKLVKVGSGSGSGSGSIASFSELSASLSVGTKSDLANNVLEALAKCTVTWTNRFAGLHSHFHSLGPNAFFLHTAKHASNATNASNGHPSTSLLMSSSGIHNSISHDGEGEGSHGLWVEQDGKDSLQRIIHHATLRHS